MSRRLSAFPALVAAACVYAGTAPLRAQFRDDFDGPVLALDPDGEKGWMYFTGDGRATMSLPGSQGHATLKVDATHDRRNIWYALIKRRISDALDLRQLSQPGAGLRLEARVRTNTAPRRVNLHFNTQRTTDFHSNLREFDLAEPNTWYTLSFTVENVDIRPTDTVYAQLALMDWGLGEYEVDVDYYRADVVTAPQPGLGEPLPYHPDVAAPERFKVSLPARHAASIDRREPEANLSDWAALEEGAAVPVLAVNGTQSIILRFDVAALQGRKVQGSGLLELTTHSVQRRAEKTKDFGLIRVAEILGGDPDWDAGSVTYLSLLQNQPYEHVFNTQMIIDLEVNDTRGGKTFATLTRPVLQRLIDGKSKGLVILPLGSIHAAFRPAQPGATDGPTLRFNFED